jgi:hypothetical protein
MLTCGIPFFDITGMSTSEVRSLFISPLLMGLYLGNLLHPCYIFVSYTYFVIIYFAKDNFRSMSLILRSIMTHINHVPFGKFSSFFPPWYYAPFVDKSRLSALNNILDASMFKHHNDGTFQRPFLCSESQVSYQKQSHLYDALILICAPELHYGIRP